MAKLNFKYATMNSGKTLDLIRTAYNYYENGYKAIIIKPFVDTKGGSCIKSRIGVEKEVDYLIKKDDNLKEILKKEINDTTCILVDEAQFMTRKQIDELFEISKENDIAVICYGLRTNFQMNSFEGSMRLLEIADELEELKTMCKCGAIARFVGRKENGFFTLNGEEIVIDGTENIEYVPLCGNCYIEKVKKKVR